MVANRRQNKGLWSSAMQITAECSTIELPGNREKFCVFILLQQGGRRYESSALQSMLQLLSYREHTRFVIVKRPFRAKMSDIGDRTGINAPCSAKRRRIDKYKGRDFRANASAINGGV